MFTCRNILYLASVLFQLLGAEMLIMYFWIIPMDILAAEIKEAETMYDGGGVKEPDEKEKDREIKKRIWFKRVSFSTIAVGYWLGALGVNEAPYYNFIVITGCGVLAIAVMVIINKHNRKKS